MISRAATMLGSLVLLVPTCFVEPGQAVPASPLLVRGYTVLPEPQEVDLQGGDFEFGSGWRLELGSGVKADDVTVESLKEGLSSRSGITLEAGVRGSGKVVELAIHTGSVEIGKVTDQNKAALEEQGYKLELASDRIRITANAAAGLFYGVETLVQLVKPADGKQWLPQGEIVDWPDLEQRNLYWDDNHHLEHLDVLKAALRQAAFYKINGFVIKLNGHFQYKSAPALVEPYALSPVQLQELTDYGLKYHIQLIPYLDGPAHIAFILKHPEYANLREFPDSNYELCATNPNSYKLLEGMYQDLLEANKGVKYFYLSTDEPYYVGLADNEQCHEAQRAKELGGRDEVLTEFVHRSVGSLHNSGRTVMTWGGQMNPADIPPYFVMGGTSGPAYSESLQAHGIREMLYSPIQGMEPYFPNYYRLAPSRLFNPTPIDDRINAAFNETSVHPVRNQTNLVGMVVPAWGDEGLHPETFWLGYVSALSWAWHSGSPSPDQAMSSFYHLFYGQGAVDMGRVYQLMSTQAEFWSSSWDSEPSSARKPLFGNSYAIFKPRRPEHDQTLPLPPVPQGEYLRLGYDWGQENTRRVEMAQNNMSANDELVDLLERNLRSVQFQRYNLRVFLSIAEFYRQNLEMISDLMNINNALKAAQTAAGGVQFKRAVAGLDRALDIAERIWEQRNIVLHGAADTWYESWYPRVAEANGRKFLNELDDVKDHLPMRTVDMSYLVYREMILPLGEWYELVQSVRNQYAQNHGLPARNKKLDWKNTMVVNGQN